MIMVEKINSLFKDNIAERECCSVPCKCNGQRGDRGAVGVPGPKVKYIFLLRNNIFQASTISNSEFFSVMTHVHVSMCDCL